MYLLEATAVSNVNEPISKNRSLLVNICLRTQILGTLTTVCLLEDTSAEIKEYLQSAVNMVGVIFQREGK